MTRKKRRLSDEAAAALLLFVSEPRRQRFGLDIIKETGLASGSLYPILHRFEQRRLLTSCWEDLDIAVAGSRRPRKLYKLDPSGAQAAEALLAEWQERHRETKSPRVPVPRMT